MRNVRMLLLIGIALTGCGGGSPYVGLWQCVDDSNNGIEITRYEDYFIITSKIAGKDSTREGTFNEGNFAVGANHLGQAMALEIDNEQLVCTQPPNFCQCNAGYQKVSSLATPSTSQASEKGKAKAETDSAQDERHNAAAKFDRHQLIADSEGFTINLHNGGQIQVFDHFRNQEYGIRMFDWPKLSYYYLPALSLAPLDSGSLAEVRETDGSTRLYMRLTTTSVDQFELIEQFHENVNTKIQASRVTPLSYQGVKVALANDLLNALELRPEQLSDLENGSLDIALTATPTADGQRIEEIVAAINHGERVPEINVELNQDIEGLALPEDVAQNANVRWQVNNHNK